MTIAQRFLWKTAFLLWKLNKMVQFNNFRSISVEHSLGFCRFSLESAFIQKMCIYEHFLRQMVASCMHAGNISTAAYTFVSLKGCMRSFVIMQLFYIKESAQLAMYKNIN